MHLISLELMPISRQNRLQALILGFAFFLLFILRPIRVVSYDALAYANGVLFGIPRQLFLPHHILYNPTNWLFFHLTRFFDPHLNPLQSMAWLNSIAGAITLGLFFLLLLKLGKSCFTALVLTILAGTSKGFFTYSTMAEAVMPLCLGIVGTLYAAFSYSRQKPFQSLLIGGLWGLTSLFHQTAFLFAPIIIAAALWRVESNQRWGVAIRLLVGAFGVAILGNLLVLILGLGVYAPSEWFNFSISYLRTGGWGKGSLAQLPLGFIYLLANGFHGFLITEPALGEQPWMLFGKIASWILLAGVFLGALQGIRKKEAWWLIVLFNLILLWVFFSWWEYNCRDFWVLPYMLMIILLAGAFPKKPNWFLIAPTIIIVIITALGNWNLHFQYFTNPGNDLAGRIAKQLAPEAQNHKVFVFTVDGSLMERLRMEGVSTSLWGNSDLQDQNILRLKQLYNFISEKGGKLLVDDDVYCQFDELIKPYLGANMQGRISQSFLNAAKEIELISTDYREIVLWRIL